VEPDRKERDKAGYFSNLKKIFYKILGNLKKVSYLCNVV
jgi:hypothetical protein